MPRDNREAESLKSVLGRIYDERGHFRNISEDGLKAEIAADEAGQSESGSEAEDEDDVAVKDTKTRPEELQAARREMITHVASAQNEALMALDFVSLLLSRDLPRQAELTMSPFLKQQLKPGTLGMDMWQNMEPNKEQEKTDDALTKGWKMRSLQESADTLLSAATRLETSVRRETEYWSQILSVSERGWSVCRMPGERHNLGVRYGFSEAQGEYGRRGLAALRADNDGHVVLDKGFGDNPKSIKITLVDGDKVVGMSAVPTLNNESEFTIKARIRHARDSLYEEELFHEIIRESRALVSYGVKMRGSSILLPAKMATLQANKGVGAKSYDIVIDLVPLADTETPGPGPEDVCANAIAHAFRLLLSHAHRERLQDRSHIPPPMSMNKTSTSLAPMLRPMLAFLQHWSTVRILEDYIQRVESLLKTASIFVTTNPAKLDFAFLRESQSVTELMARLTSPLTTSATLTIRSAADADDLSFGFDVETAITAGAFGSRFTVTAPVEPQSADFTDFADLVEHVDSGIASALARCIAVRLDGWKVSERDAMVSRASPKPGATEQVLVNVSSGAVGGDAARLLLSHKKGDMLWTSGDNDGKTFWETVDDLGKEIE